ncbi:E3 ubiquitin-protein ligase TRIM71 [Oopsacas minuta]|uniref:E3 ubiquitin-protein ligase TRIM71 n=1 Tax=Oopsacas minuta TaxID=111878 RepID=A0AAV7JUA1_9METZ|nr:E3 ubiquitin-protein ligase TRIM71 [Oopsacas minuta]
MATNQSYSSVSETEFLFVQIRRKIEETFDSLIHLINQRRNGLLTELDSIQREYEDNSHQIQSSLKKLAKDHEDMKRLSISLEADIAKEGMKKTIEGINYKIEEEENKLYSPDISFNCETNDLEWRITHLGNLARVSVQKSLVRRYTEIKKPLKKFGRRAREDGQKTGNSPRGVCIDYVNERIVISEISNSEIEIWSYEGELIQSFGKEELESPWELCLIDNSLFVTDIHLGAILKFNIIKCSFEGRTKVKYGRYGSEPGELASPAGIDSEEDELFVMECENKRISVFDLNLKFKRVIGCGMIDKGHALRVKQSTIFLLEDSGIFKLFSVLTGDLVKITKKNNLFSNYVYHFCFDLNGNFLLSDRDKNSLFILSAEGNLLHSINTAEWECESPFGIAVLKDGRIVMSFLNSDFSIVII